MMFVPDWKLGPPESPKHVPPLSPVGFAESFRNSGASLFCVADDHALRAHPEAVAEADLAARRRDQLLDAVADGA